MLDEIKRSENFTLRFRPHERQAVERAAHRSRQTPSEFIRNVVLNAAQRRVGKDR